VKVGDLVKHKFSGVGVIVGFEASETDYKVMFTNSRLLWVKSSWLEVISASR